MDKEGIEIAMQEAPDAALGAGEGICLDFPGSSPEKNCARFDFEISRSFSGRKPCRASCFRRNFAQRVDWRVVGNGRAIVVRHRNSEDSKDAARNCESLAEL